MSKLCFLCCYCYKDSLLSPRRKEGNDDKNGFQFLRESPQFQQFCRELNTDPKLIVNALEKSSSISQQLALCPQCFTSVGDVLTEKLALDQVQGEVERLQRELLNLMKQMQKHVDGYYARMREIYNVVQSSDVSCLKVAINHGGVQTTMRKKRRTRRNLKQPEENKNKVFEFRNRIIQMVNDLKIFRDGLFQKMGMSPTKTVDVVSALPLDSDSSCISGGGNPVDANQIRVEMEELQVPTCAENLMNRAVAADLGEPYNECNRNVEQVIEVDDDVYVGDGTENSEDSSDWNDTEKRLTSKSSTKKKLKDKKNKPKIYDTPTTRPLSAKKTEYLRNLDTSSWSAFRKRCISRLLRRNERKTTEEFHSSVSANADPTRCNWLTYDTTSGVVAVGGVQVLLIDTPPSSDSELNRDDDEGFYKCSLCAFVSRIVKKPSGRGHIATRENQMEKVIVNHVLGHHLNAFRCPHCDRQLKSHWRYMEHLKSHKGTFNCDICGKPCATKDSYDNHRWLHMSTEEQDEAVRNGAKNRKQYLIKLRETEGVSHICRFCGRNFNSVPNLKQHEKTHAENREIIVCPLCGKTLLKESYRIYHKNYGCSGLSTNLERIHCLVCNTKFKTKQFLARHMKRVHSTAALERLHECPVCSKKFKSAGDLLMHSKIHAEDKLWTCSKGCGKDFSVKRYWRRHELICQFVEAEGRHGVEIHEVKDESTCQYYIISQLGN